MSNKYFTVIKTRFSELVQMLSKNSFLVSSLVFAVFFIYFLLIYMNYPGVSSRDDHYFHFRFAEQIAHNPNGFFDSFRSFDTLYFTKIAQGEHFMYYNFLYYLVLIPFSYFTPLFLGIKMFGIVVLALIGLIFYLFLRNLGVRFPFLWSVGFFAVIGTGTYWRLFLSRPFVFSPLIILLVLWAVHRRKYFLVALFTFLCMFWHTATFLIPLGLVLIYTIADGFYQKYFNWRPLLSVLLGTTFGLLLNVVIDPGFIVSIKDNLFGVLKEGMGLESASGVEEGSEVYPKNFFDLLSQNAVLWLLYIFAVVVYIADLLKSIKNKQQQKLAHRNNQTLLLTLFIFTASFMVAMSNISFRFTDFFIFFAWIFIIMVFVGLFKNIKINSSEVKQYAVAGLIVCLSYLFLNNSLNLAEYFSVYGTYPSQMVSVGNFLDKNLEENEVVFNVSWSWFPQLYYHAPKQSYVAGLEPKLFYVYSPRLYRIWSNIGYGFICAEEDCADLINERNIALKEEKTALAWHKEHGDEIARTITAEFNSNYIVSSDSFGYLNVVMNNNKSFEKVLDSGSGYFIYKVVSP